MSSAAIADLTELAALDNVDALAEEQITEGKVLVVKDSGNGPGVFIFKLGTLPADTLGVASTGIPGGYWEATGYSTLTAWVESQNFTPEGHVHVSDNITNLDDFISNAVIRADQIAGLNFPDPPIQTVNSVAPVNFNVELSPADIGAVDTQALNDLRLEFQASLNTFEGETTDLVTQQVTAIRDEINNDLAGLRIDFETDIDNIPNGILAIGALIDLVAPQGTGFIKKTDPGVVALVDEFEISNINNLQTELDNKIDNNVFLNSIAAIGAIPPTSGLLRKTANNSIEIATEIPTATITGLDSFVDDRIANSTSVDWSNIQNIPASLLSLLEATGTGFLEKTGPDTWKISIPEQAKVNVAGVYGDPVCHTVGDTAVEIVPALSEDSFIKITIPFDYSYIENIVHFQDGLNTTPIDPVNHIFGFALQTGIQDYILYASAGSSVVAIALKSVEQVIVRIAPAILK